MISEANPDKIIEVWFQDEARVGQQGRLTRIWGERGKRIRMEKDMGFEYAYIYGAVCPERDLGESLVMSHVNTQTMQMHIDAISLRIPSELHGVLVTDNAPWHRSLATPQNMTIIHLPAYSPECNPHENIWEYMKNNFLSNTVFEDVNHVIDACCDAWNRLSAETGRIKSIATREWALIN